MPDRPMIDAPPRIASGEPCAIENQPQLRATIWNVSARGLFLVVDPVPEPGARLRLSFSLPDNSEPISTEAKVVWRNPPSLAKGAGSRASNVPPGCGLEFVEIKDADLERIKALVKAATATKDQSEPKP